MSGRVVRTHFEVSKRNGVAGVVEHVDRRLRLDVQAEDPSRFHDVVVQKEVVVVQVDRGAERPFRGGDPRHMVDMRVRQQDVEDSQFLLGHERQQAPHLVARIYEHGLVTVLATEHEAIFHEWRDGTSLDYHGRPMILAVLDDLMFTSKIKTAATLLGVPLAFARSSASALTQMRRSPPSLVILDLNNPSTNPLGIVAAMHTEPALAEIPTVGYVSHVDTAVVDAARRAGVTEVLARSAFTTQLAEILKRT